MMRMMKRMPRQRIRKVRIKSDKKTENATRKKEEEKGKIEAKADKKTEKATRKKEEEKGKTDQDGKGKQKKVVSEPKSLGSNQEVKERDGELEEESKMPYVECLVSGDDKKNDESRGTFKD